MTRLTRSLALVLILSVACVSHAADLLDNTTAGIDTGGGSTASPTGWAGFAFDVGATPYTIDSVNVMVGLSSGGTTTGNLTVQLYAASAGKPTGAALASKTVTGLTFKPMGSGLTPGDAALVDTTTGSTGSWAIQASQSYAIVYSTSLVSGLVVNTNPNTQLSPGTSGLTFLGRSFTSDSGGSWGGPFTTGIGWMKVTGTVAVPEPSTWAMGIAGCGIGAIAARRRKACG